MRVWELREQLEDFDEQDEVLLAMQPSWPFEYTIGRVVGEEEVRQELDGEDVDEDLRGKVWLTEGSQTRYLPGAVKHASWGER